MELSNNGLYAKIAGEINFGVNEKVFKAKYLETNKIVYWHEIFVCMDEFMSNKLGTYCHDNNLTNPNYYDAWLNDTGKDILKRLTFYIINDSQELILNV